jgi:hypothetical protein
MNLFRIPAPRPAWILIVAVAAFAPMVAGAATKAETDQAQARYRQERADCVSGRTNQERAACLKEAVNARADALHGGLNDGTADYVRNASLRCNRLAEADRQDCIARMGGVGTTTGTAATGGIYRELVTREVVTPADAPPKRAPATPL